MAVPLLLWLILSAVAQFDGSFVERLQGWDIFRLLPKWTFFAPNPGSTDYFLIYRDVSGEKVSPWREFPVLTERTAWRWLWYPEKRLSKALTDCTQAILEVARSDSEERMDLLPFTLPYLAILNVVSAQSPSDGVDGRQFAIVEKDGYLAEGSPRPLITSAVHPLRRVLS